MVWTEEHDKLFVREILVVEPWLYKQGTVKRGDAWTQISEILNSIEDPVFRVNQRGARDRYSHLVKILKKKNSDELKASGIAPPDPTEVETGIQDIMDKFDDTSLVESDAKKLEVEKSKAEEMRKMSLETFSETKKRRSEDQDGDDSPKSKRRRSTGSETMAFLKLKSEEDKEIRQQELEVKKEEILLQKQMASQQQKSMTDCLNLMSSQYQASQQQQQQMMMAQMQFQQQQTQLLAALLEKANK